MDLLSSKIGKFISNLWLLLQTFLNYSVGLANVNVITLFNIKHYNGKEILPILNYVVL